MLSSLVSFQIPIYLFLCASSDIQIWSLSFGRRVLAKWLTGLFNGAHNLSEVGAAPLESTIKRSETGCN